MGLSGGWKAGPGELCPALAACSLSGRERKLLLDKCDNIYSDEGLLVCGREVPQGAGESQRAACTSPFFPLPFKSQDSNSAHGTCLSILTHCACSKAW